MTWVKARRRTCTPSGRCACARSMHARRWNSSTRCFQCSRYGVGLHKLLALRSTEYLTDQNKHDFQLHLLLFTEHLIDRTYRNSSWPVYVCLALRYMGHLLDQIHSTVSCVLIHHLTDQIRNTETGVGRYTRFALQYTEHMTEPDTQHVQLYLFSTWSTRWTTRTQNTLY